MSSTRTHRRLARTATAVDSSAPDGTSTRPNDPGGPIRVVLASCSFGAAAIHLAMATSHAGEWLAEGIVFAISGWMQLGLAVAFVLRPTRAALLVACVANSVFIAAWAWTRAVGTPFGPEAGSVHDTGLVDLSVVALELAIVLLSALALAIPRPGELTHRTRVAVFTIVPVGVLVLATSAIVSPSATGHAHGAEDAHDHGSSAALDAGDHEHDAASALAIPDDDETDPHVTDPASAESHVHAETSEAAVSGDVPASTSVLATEDAHADDHDVDTAPSSDSADGHDTHASTEAAAAATPIDDKGLGLLENGHMAHVYGPDESLDAVTRAALVHQLALTRSIAERFPTLGDARAAGSRAAGAFGPGMGIHMSLPAAGMPDIPPPDPSAPWIPGTLTDAEILRPANLLYDGTTDDAPLAGFMYYSTSPVEPEGFAGPNDHWHTHGALCLNMGGEDGIEVLHPDEKTAESCQSIGGVFIEQTTFMVHVWTIPGYESNRGVFSDINPAIACPDGTYYTVPEVDTEQYQLSKCLSSPA